jgi:hypothetical protein
MAKMMYCFNVEVNEVSVNSFWYWRQDALEKNFDPFKTEFMFLHSDTLPFQARITPRTPAHARLIMDSYQKLNLDLKVNSDEI